MPDRSSSRTRTCASVAASAPRAARSRRSPCKPSIARRLMAEMAEPGDQAPDQRPAGAADGERREVSRRDLLVSVGVGACAAATVGAGLVTVDFLDPKVLFEPPTRFAAGLPLDYPEGTVRFNREH